jgi:hypothetical protein
MSSRGNKKINRRRMTKKRMKQLEIEMSNHPEHVDYGWFSKKVGGYGGSLHYNHIEGRAVIGYIGSTGKLRVFEYNTILFFKYLGRKIKKVKVGLKC